MLCLHKWRNHSLKFWRLGSFLELTLFFEEMWKIYPNRGRRGSTPCSRYWPFIHDFLPHIGDTVFVWRSLPGTDSHTDTLKHTKIDTGKILEGECDRRNHLPPVYNTNIQSHIIFILLRARLSTISALLHYWLVKEEELLSYCNTETKDIEKCLTNPPLHLARSARSV